MAAPASSSLFMSLGNVYRLLSLRSDTDDIILELLGKFSLEKIYAEGDKETYQHLVITLLAQLNAIFVIQRCTLPSESLQVGWYLGFIASWEVTLRSIEFVLQIVLEGRESLWEAQSLRDKYLAQLLLSALRLLILHPKAPTTLRAKDRRERFARVHRSLERIYDGYPGNKSFLFLVCKEVTDVLRNDPNAFQLPSRLRYELPNVAQELYPLPECLQSQYVSTIVPQDGFSGGSDWLSQLLALRDVTIFVVNASVQYKVNRETRDVRLQSSSARTRNAVIHALENLKLPAHLSKMELVSFFSEMFRVILPDTPSLVRRSSSASQGDESEMDALDALCARLAERKVVHRVSDREMMHGISEITRNIALLDDPSGQYRTPRPKVYMMNCGACHFAGDSQLRYIENLKFSQDTGDGAEIKLPPNAKCQHCDKPVTMMREITLARHTWDILKPLESNADTINVERHLPTQFLLGPPKPESGIVFSPGYNNIIGNQSQRPQEIDPVSPPQTRSGLHGSISEERSRSMSQSLLTPGSPGFRQKLDTPRTEFSSENLTCSDGPTQDSSKVVEPPSTTETVMEVPFSPDTVGSRQAHQQPRIERTTSNIAFEPVPTLRSRTVPVLSQPDKSKSSWFTRSKLTRSRKESSHKHSGDTSSLSSTTLESQRLEEISLKSLISSSKTSRSGRGGKTVNVCLSQNSTYALFWTQPSIHILDVGTSPPTIMRAVATESACVLAAVTKVHLAYIIGTRDQKLTLRIVNLVQPSVPVIDYKMSTSPWCKSIAICPKENYVVVGFENSLVRFFKTTNSEPEREEQLHHHHEDCRDCPPVDTLSFSNDGLVLLAGTRSPKNGVIQIYESRFPFSGPAFQELSTCRYRVALHESEDNGITSAIFRTGSGSGTEENLICITTWTQSGTPILIQPKDNHRSEIRTQVSARQGTLGSRIQCAAFSPSGRELAMVNEKGHLYQISSLNSNPMDVRRIATSKELTAKSESFAMAYMSLTDEEALILAWVDSSKSMGYVKKIPLKFDVSSFSDLPAQGSLHDYVAQGDAGVPPTPSVMHASISRDSIAHASRAELEGDQPAAELTVSDDSVGGSPENTIDHLMADIRGKLTRDFR
ncbi:hypothetical protein B0O99DRAFT_520251 [Bisporella sp. PMI_857]|nr:hypothetical protein B0O99DRAFT_520251 [Bisporella sp. PMI_857]